MEKELKNLMGEAHKAIGEYLCWQEGCKEVFGDPNIHDVKAAILAKGAEQIVRKTTWSFNPSTEEGYDKWVDEKVRWDSLPNELSKAAYLDVFRTLLTAQYLKEKNDEENRSKTVLADS